MAGEAGGMEHLHHTEHFAALIAHGKAKMKGFQNMASDGVRMDGTGSEEHSGSHAGHTTEAD